MNIPADILEKWKVLRSAGDAAKIVELSEGGFSDETVNRALRTGKCSDELFEVMGRFYQDKAEVVKEYL